MRVSRKRVEGCGALTSNIQKREVNFSRTLCYIFVRCMFVLLVILLEIYELAQQIFTFKKCKHIHTFLFHVILQYALNACLV